MGCRCRRNGRGCVILSCYLMLLVACGLGAGKEGVFMGREEPEWFGFVVLMGLCLIGI